MGEPLILAPGIVAGRIPSNLPMVSNMSDFGRKLASAVTEQDRKAMCKRGYNPYALGIMLGAAHEVEAEVEAGSLPAAAFADHFTPTRENHAMARKLGLPLDVQRGRWVAN